jgi:hypothetical protein
LPPGAARIPPPPPDSPPAAADSRRARPPSRRIGPRTSRCCWGNVLATAASRSCSSPEVGGAAGDLGFPWRGRSYLLAISLIRGMLSPSSPASGELPRISRAYPAFLSARDAVLLLSLLAIYYFQGTNCRTAGFTTISCAPYRIALNSSIMGS